MTCSCRNHIKTNATRPHIKSKLAARRLDAPGINLIQKRFIAEATRRFRWLKKQIFKQVVTDDCFGLENNIHTLAKKQFAFTTSAKKVDEFMGWLEEQNSKGVLDLYLVSDHRAKVGRRAWENVYIQSAYKKGMVLADKALKKKGIAPSTLPGQPTFPVDYLFNQPVHADKIGLVYTRTFNELRGVTDSMAQGISRSLAQGLAEGRSPRQIARDLDEKVDGIGIARARLIARTEIMRAHHVGAINTYREAGVQGVRVQAEFSTAGDEKVCEDCADLDGKVFTLDQIESVIPVHPNCRCVSLPVVNDDDMVDEKVEPDEEDPTPPTPEEEDQTGDDEDVVE